MTDLDLFFVALSSRAYKENDLSDITYAMCQSSKAFKKFFLDFFFKDANLNADEVIFEREHSTEMGRPDFWIRVGNLTYIVEVKIWDGSHHFDQYNKILSKANDVENAWTYLGYITNYKLKHDNVSVKTWREMYDQLMAYDAFNDSMIKAYLSYLKKVCVLDVCKIDDFVFESKAFNEIKGVYAKIQDCIKQKEGVESYNRSVNFKSKQWMGQYFELKEFKETQSIWGFLGVVYQGDKAHVCVSFLDSNGWGKLLCDQYRERINHLLECGESAFTYKDTYLNFYMTNEDQDVGAFFGRVLKTVREKTEWDGVRKEFPKLVAMKKLPLCLEQKFFDITTDKYTIRLSEDQKDSENPASYCGRYFEIVPIKSSEKLPEIIRGWMGAYYQEKSGEWEFIIQILNGRKYETKATYDRIDKDMTSIKVWFVEELQKIVQ